MTEALLQVENVDVRFGGVTALRQVSLDIRPGEICGLIGPNGAGKTTLFDVVAGARYPSSGTVRLRGADITRRSATWRSRHGIRRTFQRSQVFGWLSAEDNVLAAMEWRGGGGGFAADLIRLPPRRRLERTRRASARRQLRACGVAEVADATVGLLPTGRTRLVELARALGDGPGILLLDEPTSGLEEAEVARMAATIQEARASSECAIVLVEHNVGFVMALCDRVIVLHLGEVIAVGTPAEVRADPLVRNAYLG